MPSEITSPTVGTETLPELLDAVAEEHPNREALVSNENRLTYAEFRDRVRAFSRGLLDIGVRKGDRVGVLLSNRPEWFIATYGALQVGATIVALNTWHTPEELRYGLRQADISTLVTQDSFLDNDYLDAVEAVAPGVTDSDLERLHAPALPQLRTVIVCGDGRDWTREWKDVERRGKALPAELDAAAKGTVYRNDPAYILFSSGTTGKPKPIVLCHDGLVANSQAIGANLGISADDRFWLALPLFFSFAACNESITALAHGATLILQERFEAERALGRIKAEECTVIYAMGNMLRRMEGATDTLADRLANVRIAMTIAPSSLRRRYEIDYGVKTLTGYGLTEVSAICALTSHNERAKSRHETMGRPLPGVDLRIVDPETGREVAPGEQGHIRLRTRTMFVEYYGMPEKTQNTFDADGYFKTGDIGRQTPDGHLIFEGRADDMIKTGGINVSPQEVADAIERHPDVTEATVIGLPNEEKDEVVAASVIPAAKNLTSADIQEFAAERLAAYKVPTEISIRDEDFPRTDTGKVRKVELEDEFDAP